MNNQYFGDYPATILSYDGNGRTAMIEVAPVTNGLDGGIEATFAYPVGHDDKDTEIKIVPGAECYVLFLQGDPYSPVIWAFRSHGKGAVVDYRRIRQKNIELFADQNINLYAKKVVIEAQDIILKGNVTHIGDYMQLGKYTLTGSATISGGLGVQGNSNFASMAYFPVGAVINGIQFSVHYHVGVHGNTSSPM